jgi:hypothetical protein
MAALEELKGYAERVTGIRRPGNKKATKLVLTRKPNATCFKNDGLIPNHARWPLAIYRNVAPLKAEVDPAAVIEELLEANGWGDTWLYGLNAPLSKFWKKAK